MDIAPIYELRNRLRTAMIAGTNLLAEDFRLKRAAEDMKPLAQASPVFAKISELTGDLLSDKQEDKEGVLLDVITLVDAVLCTQGQVFVSGNVEPVAIQSFGSAVTNAPYSVVKTLVDALTSSGNGHYQYVVDTHKNQPELFCDYRIKAAMVQALGASYAELAEQAAVWLKQDGKGIIPLLQNGFDPKGKKEMVRRVQVMDAAGKEACNAFYRKMLPDAQKDVRQALIYALRHSTENVELLLDLIKTEKGNVKKTAYCALACLEDERAEKLFLELYEKKPVDAMMYMKLSGTKWASEMTAKCLIKQLELCKTPVSIAETEILRMILEAIPGKNGRKLCEAIRAAFETEDIFYVNPENNEVRKWAMHVQRPGGRLEVKCFREAAAVIFETAVRVNPDEHLCALAEELYENTDRKPLFFTAAFMVKLLGKKDCSVWLKEQLFSRKLFGTHSNGSLAPYLAYALHGLVFDSVKREYVLRTAVTDGVNDTVVSYEYPVGCAVSDELIQVLMEYSEFEVDRELIHIVNTNNEEQCQKFQEYFYQKALKGPTQDRRMYWSGLRQCGSECCRGLLTGFLKHQNSTSGPIEAWRLYSLLRELPGTAAAFDEEAQAVYEQIVNGTIKVKTWNEESYWSNVKNAREWRTK